MTREREPFVSGLPGSDLRTPQTVDLAGVAVLTSLRTWAARLADEARPASQPRYIAGERSVADLDAIATVEACDAFVRLIDGLLRDPLLAGRAAVLVRERH